MKSTPVLLKSVPAPTTFVPNSSVPPLFVPVPFLSIPTDQVEPAVARLS